MRDKEEWGGERIKSPVLFDVFILRKHDGSSVNEDISLFAIIFDGENMIFRNYTTN